MGCTRTEQTFCRNSPAWNFIFYTLILVIGLLIFFSYFVKNVTRNFKNQDWLWINCQSKMHTSLCKGRSNSPTATTDKEGEWLRTGDMTRLHSLRLRQGWKLIGCYQVQGQECHTIHLNESKCFCTETACTITSYHAAVVFAARLVSQKITCQMEGVPAAFSIKTKHSKDYNIIQVILSSNNNPRIIYRTN